MSTPDDLTTVTTPPQPSQDIPDLAPDTELSFDDFMGAGSEEPPQDFTEKPASRRRRPASAKALLAELCLDKALGRDGRRLVRRGGPVAILIRVPSTSWVRPIEDAARSLAKPGSPSSPQPAAPSPTISTMRRPPSSSPRDIWSSAWRLPLISLLRLSSRRRIFRPSSASRTRRSWAWPSPDGAAAALPPTSVQTTWPSSTCPTLLQPCARARRHRPASTVCAGPPLRASRGMPARTFPGLKS